MLTEPRTAAVPDGGRLTRRQRIALWAPIAVIGTMFPVFRLLDAAVGHHLEGYLGWYLGLVVYWVVWCVGFPMWILGAGELRRLLRPSRPTPTTVGLVIFPAAMAGLVRWAIPDLGYEKPTLAVAIVLLSTTFGNGVGEELLWRGVYLRLYPARWPIRVVWASVMFGLWHYVPVSLDATGPELWGMIAGPVAFGFILATLAKRTDGVWWPIVAHVVGGWVMIA